MKTTVIYHSADYDGIFCGEIARKFLPPDTEFIGWNFGDKPLMCIPGENDLGMIYIMDLPVDKPLGLDFNQFKRGETWKTFLGEKTELIWIDHHKTSIETHPRNIFGYRIDGVAACRLAWQWFSGNRAVGGRLPTKEEFVSRSFPSNCSEPLAVRLAGEYDVWDKRDPDAETFQYGLRSQREIPFALLLEQSKRGKEMTHQVIADGQSAQRYAQKVDEGICKSLTWLMKWEGLTWLCVNHARFNSLLFAARDIPETGHDALLGFRFDGKTWMVSLYHANHRKDIDLSEIAKKYGGGGHRGACGFTCKTLPYKLSTDE